MSNFPAPIQNLIENFNRLPGIGRKTAERLVFHLLKTRADERKSFADNLTLLQNVKFCVVCRNFTQADERCAVCRDPKRDRTQICVVEDQHDLNVLEETREYHGLYHVLGGVLNPLEDQTEKDLNIQKLEERIAAGGVAEIILALNPDIHGEATSIFLKKKLQPRNIKITRLARGLPMGADLEYADEITLANALKGRREL
jgi:recombination protein RecR